MRWIMFTLLLLAGAILDGGNLLNIIALGSWHTKPSILIIILVFASLHTKRRDSMICSFATGFTADLVAAIVGPHMICYGLFGFILNSTSRLLSLKRPLFQGILVFLFYLLTELLSVWLEGLKTGQYRSDSFWKILSAAMYSGLAAPVVWYLLSSVWWKMGGVPHERVRV